MKRNLQKTKFRFLLEIHNNTEGNKCTIRNLHNLGTIFEPVQLILFQSGNKSSILSSHN